MPTNQSPSAKIRAELKHPVIDADGHTIEFMPAVREHLKDLAGGELTNKVFSHPTGFPDGWYRLSPEDRLANRRARPPWWGLPAENTLDRSTAMLPKLMYERLEETGADFSIVYPTVGLMALGTHIDEVRLALCRALNNYHAEVFAPYRDRLSPVAVIPTNNPAEAIAELDYAVGDLGFKNVLLCGLIQRPLQGGDARRAFYLDHLGIDSPYDYDPVWQRCQELGVAPAFHSGGMGWGSRNSPNNYMFNHVGHFAAACDATCKSLFMAGVTKRFPDMRFAFLEGGTAWAVTLYNDLIGHWKKRNRDDVRRYDPRRLNVAQMRDLFESHGQEVLTGLNQAATLDGLSVYAETDEIDAMLDEWAPIGIERGEDIRDRFVPHFYFGCEADDPMNALAFDNRLNAYDAKLRAIFSSDVGHWDVPDIREVLEEAFELVDDGFLTEADFRDFTYGHSLRLYTDMNPDFFDNTVIEAAANADLGRVLSAMAPDEEATFRRVRVLFGDQLNLARGKYLPADLAAKGAMRVSIASYGATYSRKLVPIPGAGFAEGLPDVDVVFDPDNVRPGWEDNTDVVLGSLHHDGKPADLCARSALSRAIHAWQTDDLRPMVGLESEAYVFERADDQSWVPYDAPGHFVYGTGPQVDPAGLFDELWASAHRSGFPVESINTEFDLAQFEMVLRYSDALTACDEFFLFRTMARDMFFRRGYLLSFMPRPIPKLGGNGMHINLSFLDAAGKNALDGGTRPGHLSALSQGLIAGLLHHHQALAGILAPITNSYERLKPAKASGYWANWGFDHRSAAVRVSSETGSAARIEHRLADGAANPHLAVAAVLHAARLGVERGYELPAPEDKDGIYNVSTDRHVPTDLGEALDRLAADDALVEALGRPLIENYVALKRAELDELKDKAPEEVFAYYVPYI